MKERREAFGYGIKQLASRLDLCLWPGDECSGKAIRAHSVQNNGVLEALSSNGHVIMPRLEMSFDQAPKFIFRKIGRNNATTFTGLCGKHDHALFEPVEAHPIDLSNKSHVFLLAYRAVLKEAHTTRKSAIDTQLSYQKGIEKGLFPKDEPSPPGMLAVEQMMSAYLVEGVRLELGVAYLSEDWSRVGHQVIELDAVPGIAVNSMFSTGIYSEASDGPAFAILNVFPIKHTTVAIFSYLSEHRAQALEAFGDIWSSSGQYQQYLLSNPLLLPPGRQRRAISSAIVGPRQSKTFGVIGKVSVLLLACGDSNNPKEEGS